MKKVFGLILLTCLINIAIASTNVTYAQEKEEIVIGAPLPSDFLYGWTSKKAMQLAVEEINERGGVKVGNKKMPFKVIYHNTRDLEPSATVDGVLYDLETLITEEKIDFLIGGPCRSEIAIAGLDIDSKHKIIHMYTSGVLSPGYHKKIASDLEKYKYGFRITSHGGVIAGDFLDIAKEIREKYGLNKIYLMLQNVAHAQKGGEIMKSLFEKAGFEITGQSNYNTGTIDYSRGLLESVSKGTEILFIWMDMPESAILLKQWSDLKVKSLPVGFISAAEQPGFWEATDGGGEYLLVNTCNAGNVPSGVTSWTKKFAKAYEKKWGIEPEGYGCSTGYMAPYVLKDAIERAGTLDTDEVIKALEETDLMGVYGRIRFDESHQVIPAADPEEGAVTCLFQWQQGRRVQVFPPKVAEAEILLPPWMEK